MIRVLHVFYEMGNGGIEHFVMDYYKNINREEIQFDFLTSVEFDGYFDEEIRALGGRVFKAYPLKKNPVKNYCDIVKIIRDNNYDIVHRHTGSAFGYWEIRAAKKAGAKHQIIHSHNPQVGKPWLDKLCKLLLRTKCIRFACSKAAGEFLFGKGSSFKIMNNAINCEKYRFRENIRNELRKSLGLEDKLVIGHIGRIERQKNHKKLLSIFAEIKKFKSNAILVCLGTGSLLLEIKKQIEDNGLQDSVMLLGQRDDVDCIINVFDLFLFPSLYEGFSITLIEAQVNGLKCYTSLEKVPQESNLSGNVSYISLEESDQAWAKHILDSSFERDLEAIERIKNEGYDILEEAGKLEEFYKGLK